MDGNDIPMPSEFDDFTEKARLDCQGTTGEARKNGEFLRDIMVNAVFQPEVGADVQFVPHPVPIGLQFCFVHVGTPSFLY